MKYLLFDGSNQSLHVVVALFVFVERTQTASDVVFDRLARCLCFALVLAMLAFFLRFLQLWQQNRERSRAKQGQSENRIKVCQQPGTKLTGQPTQKHQASTITIQKHVRVVAARSPLGQPPLRTADQRRAAWP